MKREIAIAVAPGESWAALSEDGAIVELRLARAGSASHVGEIYLGRVSGLRPALPAALVDIGLGRPAFLSAEDVLPKGGFARLHEGQAVTVAVVKDSRADKATGVSMRLPDKSVVPPPGAKPPLRLDAPSPAAAALIAPWLDNAPDHIRIDDRAAYAELRHWLMAGRKELVERLAFAAGKLYEDSGIGEAVEEALSTRLGLAKGGALVIEATALGATIDVDSGQAGSALDANLEASKAVARQIRLRNLSGPILVGFVGMKGKSGRERVLAALRQALARQAKDCQVLGWTRLGHVELVRKRRAPSLAELAGGQTR
ncbi:MAG TPA: ribonuclease E/G [Stellaceae bacterium]|nr:ribonuclease E/G [Stellaceae bacterium]